MALPAGELTVSGLSRTSILALFLTVSLPCAAERDVRTWPLDAATTLVLVEDHRAPLVYLSIEFPVGSWSEWGRRNGLEEAFEIQLYDPPGRLRARADELAADLSIEVGTHAATIDAACLRDDLADLLELVRDVLTNDAFDKKELTRWKQSSRIEWKSAQKIPQFRLAQARSRLFFADRDPRRLPYEKPRSLVTDRSRLAEVRDTVVRTPGRVIAFAGALDEADARRLATGLLPPPDDEPPPGLAFELQPMTSADRLPAAETESMKRINQTFFHYGRDSVTYEDPRYPAFLVADHVLGGHFHSRISRALRHEGGETYAAYTTGEGGPNQEAYGIGTFTRAENTEATEGKLRDLLAAFHEAGITEEERRAAVGFLLGRRPFSRQSPEQVLSRYLWELRNGLSAGYRDELIDRAAAVPLEQVNAFIREFYDPASFVMLEVRPE
jgi:zinc protease